MKESLTYELTYTSQAIEDIQALVKSGKKGSITKLHKILLELEKHPETGTGKPDRLKYKPLEWSRRIDQQNRLVYTIEHSIVTVTVLSALGHYGEK